MTHEVVYEADGCEHYNDKDTATPIEAGARESARLHNMLIHGEDSETSPCARPRRVHDPYDGVTA